MYPAIKFPCICFRHKNRRRSRRGIVSSGWRNGGYLDSYSRPKFVQSRQIYCRSHARTRATPHLGGRARRSGLHIILSGSGSRADSLTIVYDGTWTTHTRLHISRLSCSECIGGERGEAQPPPPSPALQRCSWPRRNAVADKKNCSGLIWITGRNSLRQRPRLLYYCENASVWWMLRNCRQGSLDTLFHWSSFMRKK